MADNEHVLAERPTEVVRIARLAAASAKTSLGTAVQGLGVTSFLVILVAYFSLTANNFLTYSNWITILSTASIIGIVSIGQTLVIIAGGFDLSVAGYAPLGAVLYARFSNSGMLVAIAVIATIGVGIVGGTLNGLIITRLKINPLITTLATLSISGGLAYTLASGSTISISDPAAGDLANTSIRDIPNQVWLLLFLTLAAWFILRQTIVGRSIYAIGGNREASWFAGIRVDALTTGVYATCGALATFSGAILASQLLAADGTLGNNYALTSIAAVVLGGAALGGGVGSVFGTLVGGLILGTLGNGLTLLFLSAFYQQIITGVVLLLAVGFSRLRAYLNERRGV